MYFHQNIYNFPKDVDRIVDEIVPQLVGEISGPLSNITTEILKAGVDCRVAAARMIYLLRILENSKREILAQENMERHKI